MPERRTLGFGVPGRHLTGWRPPDAIPEMQRRSLFRTQHEGMALRANPGLRVPENRRTVARRA